MSSVYDYPDLLRRGYDDDDEAFVAWALAVRKELAPVYGTMRKPLPDDPVRLDTVVTQEIDGWLPRVASLAVLAEYHLDSAKERHWPGPISDDGEKLNVTDREVRMTTSLAPYRLVRDDLDQLVKRMSERVRWAQSVRKQQGEAQGGY